MKALSCTPLLIALLLTGNSVAMTMSAKTLSEERMRTIVLDHMFYLSVGEGMLTRQHRAGQLEAIFSLKNTPRDHPPEW